MSYEVLIVDDERLIREMFAHIVTSAQKCGDGYNISGMVTDSESAVSHCKTHHVDLVLMDVVLGGGTDGIETAKTIKGFSPETKFLLVTSMMEAAFITRAREAGIESFWHKEVQEQPLLDVMNRTMHGESVYPSRLPKVWFGKTVSTQLTKREMEVLHELVSGISNVEIAEKLGISERTVKRHIEDMLIKTGFKNRLQLAVRARGGGLVVNEEYDADE
jgi:two-component system vancomycin resistance associated response regulator VraR